MRVTTCLLLCSTLLACKTTRASRSSELQRDSLENEEQLPACDDITVGRVYWVRSVKQALQCVEGGAWKPRSLDAEGQTPTDAGPRTIP